MVRVLQAADDAGLDEEALALILGGNTPAVGGNAACRSGGLRAPRSLVAVFVGGDCDGLAEVQYTYCVLSWYDVSSYQEVVIWGVRR